jgi:RecB family exonuclease
MSFRFLTATSSGPLAEHLAAEVRPDDLILVGTQLMERELRRRLQAVLKGPAPVIRVLSNWLEEQAVVFGDEEPGIVLGPKDLELLFDHWTESRDGAGASLRYPEMIAALSEWLAVAARGGVDVSAFASDPSPVLRELAAFSVWLRESGFRIREALPGQTDTATINRVWLYQVDYLYPTQVRALNAIRERLTVLLCTPEEVSPAYIDTHRMVWGVPTQTVDAPEAGDVRMQVFPTPQSEVRAVMERLLEALGADGRLRLTDFVVLVSDLAVYRPYIEDQSRLHGLPVQLSQGDTLRSNPILNRFGKLLRMRLNGFELTDVMEVFGDALIRIPGLSSTDIRQVYRTCLQRNQKSLRDAEAGALSVIPSLFGGDHPRPLSAWCEAQLTLLRNVETEADREVRTRSEQFTELLRGFASTHSRLRLDPVLTESAFFRLFDRYLSGRRERTEDKPDALLFTEIHHFPDVHGKRAIVIGLCDALHPGKSDHPILNRFGSELGKHVEAFTPDPFLEARHHLARVLRSADEIWLSHPDRINDARTTPSMLWTDIAEAFPEASAWPEVSGKVWELPTARILAGDPHAALIARIGAERRRVDHRGMYDGMMTTEAGRRVAWERLQKDGWMPLSASRLDLYARSPFDFLFKHVLGIREDLRFSDDADETVKGTVLHNIMQTYHRTQPWPEASTMDACVREIRRIADEVLDEHTFELGAADSPFPSLFRRQVHALLPWILKGEAERVPLMSDVSRFRPVSLEWNWAFELDQDKVRVNGVIDRVDVDPATGHALIIDYKTGTTPQPAIQDIEAGTAFQMALYWWAVRKLGHRPVAAAYWKLPIRQGKAGMDWQEVMVAAELAKPRKKTSIRTIEELDALVDDVIEDRIPTMVGHMLEGRYPLPLVPESYPSDIDLARRFNRAVQAARAAFMGIAEDEEEADDAE